jgi:hypothetical protein
MLWSEIPAVMGRAGRKREMNSFADHNNETQPHDLDMLLRRVDASVELALAEDADVGQGLSQVKAAGTASTSKTCDGEFAEVLAAWVVELLVDASRGPGTVIRAVDDPAFFCSAVGRVRVGLEPWPEIQVTLSDTQPQQVSVAVCLPGLASPDARVTATIVVASWSDRVELRPIGSMDDDAGDSVVEIGGTVTLPEMIRLSAVSVTLSLSAP